MLLMNFICEEPINIPFQLPLFSFYIPCTIDSMDALSSILQFMSDISPVVLQYVILLINTEHMRTKEAFSYQPNMEP